MGWTRGVAAQYGDVGKEHNRGLRVSLAVI